MLLVLALAGALWGLGAAMRVPRDARLYMLGLLYVGVLAIQVVLPVGHPVKEATGGHGAYWILLGLLVGVVVFYRTALRRLRARARHAEVEPGTEGTDHSLERHARHIVLREIGGPGQRALREARVLVVGAGGLGSPALLYLTGAGVGTIGVIDDDVVDVSNLQRQVIHRDADARTPKVASAIRAMKALDPRVEVRPYNRRLTEDIAGDLVAEYDLVLDGTDDGATRAAVNRACAAAGVPLVHGALSQWEGQLTVLDPARGAPCRHCLFPEDPAPGLAPSCAEGGVAGPLPGVIGAAMALEAVKVITGAGTPLRGRLMLWDGLDAEVRVIGVARDPACAVCGAA